MKTALILVSLCFLLGLGALGLSLVTSRREAPKDRVDAAAPAVAATPAPSASSDASPGELLARLDALSREIDELHAEIAALKAGAAREPAAEAVPEKPLDEPASAFASEHRGAILKVIEEDRAEQKRRQEEEQRARDLQSALARAERTAKQFGLAQDQQKALADVYILERQKMEELRAQMRDQAGLGGDPESLRQGFREMRDWRLNELTNRFGADLATKINEADFERFRGGFGPGGGGRRGNRGPGDPGTEATRLPGG